MNNLTRFKIMDDSCSLFHFVHDNLKGLYFSVQRPNLKNLSRGLDLRRGLNMVGST